jgi:hypothetical protein
MIYQNIRGRNKEKFKRILLITNNFSVFYTSQQAEQILQQPLKKMKRQSIKYRTAKLK